MIATGQTHSVQEFLARAFSLVDLNWENHMRIDQALYHPAETDLLLGCADKAKSALGWQAKTKFDGLVEMMIRADE